MSGNAEVTQKFTYGRMFTNLGDVEDEALIALGRSMHNQKSEKSKITSGYTFLGQFIDHDLSQDQKAREFPQDEIDPSTLINERQPFFNLDILYGDGPEKDEIGIYEPGTCRLKLGNTVQLKVPRSFPNDLPRAADSLQPATVDPRQDENMGISQMHVAFIKFHNAVIDKEFAGNADVENFKNVEKMVVQHYQWIVLNDFLPTIIRTDVLQEVKDLILNDPDSKKRLFRPTKKSAFMPVECSVAAYRMGHSMVSQQYNWNKLFPKTTVHELSAYTSRGNMNNLQESDGSGNFRLLKGLPSRWIIDWTRFFNFLEFEPFKDLPEAEKTKYEKNMNYALRIDASVIPQFRFLIPNQTPAHRASLAIRNLFRGRSLGLPCGQDVAEKLGVKAVSRKELEKDLSGTLLGRFVGRTPLWYYVLKEAEVERNGNGLGAVGSRIIAETFLGLMKISPYSILGTDWKPTLGPEERREKFGMVDLLMYVAAGGKTGEKAFNELNPLEFLPDPTK